MSFKRLPTLLIKAQQNQRRGENAKDEPYLLIKGQAVRLGLNAGSVYEHARISSKAGERQADVLVDGHNLSHRSRILQLCCGLLLDPCTRTASE